MSPVCDLVGSVCEKSREIVLEAVNVWVRAHVQTYFNALEDPIIDSADFVFLKVNHDDPQS